MKKIFEIIKEHFVLLLGTGLFTYALFNFHSGRYLGKSGLGISITTKVSYHPVSTYYYYNNGTSILLVMGAILIVIGLLGIKKAR